MEIKRIDEKILFIHKQNMLHLLESTLKECLSEKYIFEQHSGNGFRFGKYRIEYLHAVQTNRIFPPQLLYKFEENVGLFCRVKNSGEIKATVTKEINNLYQAAIRCHKIQNALEE
jgi:hypothetical protein